MMNSIRKKLLWQIGMLISILILLSLVANTFFFRFFQENNTKKHLISNYEAISQMNPRDYNKYNLEKIEHMAGIDILIFDENSNIIYTSKKKIFKPDNGKKVLEMNIGKYLPPSSKITKSEVLDDGVELLWVKDAKTKVRDIHIIGRMQNGCIINMRLPLMPIELGVNQANIFDLYIGLIMIPIGIIFAYFISKSFTKPILEMNKKTDKLKRLDFNNKCTVYSNDELGQLAQSINEMSEELSDTIKSLNDTNSDLQNEMEENEVLHEQRKELLNNVSHELKTPLALMQGYAEGLKLNVADNHGRKDFYCEVIIDEAKKMNSLLEEILNFNHEQEKSAELNKESFDAITWVKYISDKYIHKYLEYDINFESSLEDGTFVFGDKMKLEQVLTNYLNNAVRYADDNKEIKIQVTNGEDAVRINIFNTCEPVSEDDLKKIWDSFYKVDKARTREVGGFGLGLSIVKSIMERHDEEYGVYQDGEGINFWFEIGK